LEFALKLSRILCTCEHRNALFTYKISMSYRTAIFSQHRVENEIPISTHHYSGSLLDEQLQAST